MDTVRDTGPLVVLAHPAGDSVGRFKLVERLGSGGMGDVFVAFDPQLERQVALKLLKLSRAGDDSEAQRLLREANAMAKISHPNVVGVFDAGLDGDRPWVAMELVRGTTMREWLATKRSWQQSLGALCQVARGLEAAHRAGLVHRDVKPENVLIGSDGRVAVTDFGIAQAAWAPPMVELATPATPQAVRDRAQTSGVVMGTPGYMAPEQYLRLSTDERTDQYAFAVTAYEALYGELPFAAHGRDLGTAAVEAVTTDPKPPKAGGVPAGVWRALEIALKPPKAGGVPAGVWRALEIALKPKPEDRFPSIKDLREQLEKALPSKRSRWPMAVGVAVPLAAALAFIGRPHAADPCLGAQARLNGVWDAPRQQAIGAAFLATNLAYADDSWRAVKNGVGAYSAAWQDMYGEACRATRVEGRQSESLMDLRMGCLERNRSVLAALTDVWAQPLSPETVQAAPRAVAGLPPLSACADARGLTERVPVPKDPAVAAKVAAARSKVDAVVALNLAGKEPEAKAAAATARAEAEATGFDEVRAEAALAQGNAVAALEGVDAEPAYLDAARLAGASRDDRLAAEALIALVHHLAEDRQSAAKALLVASVADGVLLRAGDDVRLRVLLTRFRGGALMAQNSLPEARAAFTAAYELGQRSLGEKDPDTTANVAELARVAEAQGDYVEARKLGDQVVAAAIERFGPNHPTVASRLNNLAMAVDSGGDHAAAIEYYRRALAIKAKAYGPDSASTATTLNNLAIVLIDTGQVDEARQMLDRALAIREKVLGPDHPFVATTLGNLGDLYRNQGEMKKAIELEERALAIKTKAYGPVHANVANSLAELGKTYQAMGDEAKALDYYQRSFDVRTKALGPEHRLTLHSVNLVAGALIAVGKCADAAPKLEANLAATEKLDGGKAPQLAHALTLSAECALVRGQAAQAQTLLGRALAIQAAAHGDDQALGEAHWALGRADWALGQKPQALEAVRSAEHELSGDATFARTLRAVKAWLQAHPG